MTSSPCPFCTPDPARVFFRGDRAFALWDATSMIESVRSPLDNLE